MNTLESNIQNLQERIARSCKRSNRSPDEITIVAVTKGFKASAVESACNYGIWDFGENRVREAEQKIGQLSALRSRLTWHMIGHLQSNKANLAAGLFDVIHSVDSIGLAKKISQSAGKTLSVFLQVNVSAESTKSGFNMEELPRAVDTVRELPNLNLIGLMTIAPLTSDPETVRPLFSTLREMGNSISLKHLSMGMTDDFEVAIEEGATVLRIGRGIFGDRR